MTAAARTAARVAAKFGAGNAKKPKGYAQGGSVSSPSKRPGYEDDDESPPRAPATKWNDPTAYDPRFMPPEIAEQFNAPDELGGYKKGGKIKRVAGKPIGKDDGVIAAQKGEYVVRKAAAQKYGARKLGAVNRGTARISAGKK